MLYSFTAVKGPRAGTTLYLPTVYQDDTRTGHVNRMQNAMTDIEEMDGVYLSSGGDAMYRSYAEVQAVFDFYPAWLSSNKNKNYYTGIHDDRAAVRNAIADFMTVIVMGGLGNLVDTQPSGAINPITGAAISKLTCTAVVNGDYEVKYLAGAIRAQITASFMIPSGSWTTPDGYLIPIY